MTTDLGDLHRLSRAELEPVLARCLRVGEADNAEAIRAELAGRTWQHLNPYAPPPPEAPSDAAHGGVSAVDGSGGS